ncbi:cytochrome P450 4V2-like [Panonychus citri]|uniref:cytochrome P450 4V2-like n=1 Tax=Panonychus citri TaxID=50023 RepID=UPI002306FA42|nr:cytochrome P450 4V2-like [Panonychus citri]
MDVILPILGNYMKIFFEFTTYSMILLTLYYFVYVPISNLIFHIYYAHRFHYTPCHPIYGHLRNLIPKFPDPSYDLKDSSKNFYELMMKLNDPVKGDNVSIMWIGWLPVYIISGAAGIEAVLSKSNITKPHFYKFIGLRDGLVTSDPDKWRVRRKFIEPFFKTKRHQHFASVMDKEISKLPDQIMDKIGQPYDIENLIHESALSVILEISWGIPCDECHDMKRIWLDVLNKGEVYFIQRVYNPLFWYTGLYLRFEAGKKYQENLQRVVEGLEFVENLKQKERETKIMAKMNNNDDGGKDNHLDIYDKDNGSLYDFIKHNNETGKVQIDRDGIDEELLTMAAAGHETVSVGLRWTLFTLGNNLEIQERLYQEIIEIFPDDTPTDDLDKLAQCKFLDQCLKESLRLNPPIHGVSRQLDEDVTINGSKILKNSVVILNFSATHHDAKIFPDPLKYDPDRWSLENETILPKGAFTPFALGPRNCIGYRYALLEMKIYLINIIRRFQFVSVRKPEEVTRRYEIALQPNCPLEQIFTPRK